MPDEREPTRADAADERQPDHVTPDEVEPSIADAVALEEGTPGTRRQQRVVKQLEPFFAGANLLLYGFVGILLIGLAVAALAYALFSIPKNLAEGVPVALTSLLTRTAAGPDPGR